MTSDELRFLLKRDRLKLLLEEPTLKMHFDDLKQRMSGTAESKDFERFTTTFLKYPPRCYAIAFTELSEFLQRQRPPRDEDGEYSLPRYSYGLSEDDYDYDYISTAQQRACLHDLVRLCLYERQNAPFAVTSLIERATECLPWPYNPDNTPPI